MTYRAQEDSAVGGSPVELYEFALGSEVFRFSSGEDEVEVEGLVFSPLEISRTTIVVSQEQQGDVINVSVPAATDLVRRYINVVPGQLMTLSIFRLHRTDTTEQRQLSFKGVVRNVGFTLNGLQATISVQPITSGLSRNVPRYVFSNGCNHVLYDSRCGVNSTLFRYDGTIATVSGASLTVTGLSDPSRPDGWATGGFVTSPNGTDFRLILTHVGNVVNLLLPFTADVVAGNTVQVFAGCAHDIQTCASKFNNVPNYGGFNWVPRNNVFASGVPGAS